jgi:hypothetical protein
MDKKKTAAHAVIHEPAGRITAIASAGEHNLVPTGNGQALALLSNPEIL